MKSNFRDLCIILKYGTGNVVDILANCDTTLGSVVLNKNPVTFDYKLICKGVIPRIISKYISTYSGYLCIKINVGDIGTMIKGTILNVSSICNIYCF